MNTIQTEIPEQLYKKAQALVREGWFRDEKDIFSEAIRRFLARMVSVPWKRGGKPFHSQERLAGAHKKPTAMSKE